MNRFSASLILAAATLAAGNAAAQDSVSESETRTESKGYLAVLPFYLSVDRDRNLAS